MITREEIEKAKDLLKMIEVKEPNELIVNSWWGSFAKDYKEALQIAIKVLEQKSDEAVNTVIESLEQQPSADAVSQKIDEFELNGKTAEIWIVKGKLQIRCLGVIHNISLSSVIPQPCTDCISREAVLEILKKNRYCFNISQEGYCEGKVLWSENLIKDDACKEIEQLPSVTAKEKIGHWKVQHTNLSHLPSDTIVTCLECGHTKSKIDGEILNFCPNCGAKMRGR